MIIFISEHNSQGLLFRLRLYTFRLRLRLPSPASPSVFGFAFRLRLSPTPRQDAETRRRDKTPRQDAHPGRRSTTNDMKPGPQGRGEFPSRARPGAFSPFTFHLSPFTFHLSPFTFHTSAPREFSCAAPARPRQQKNRRKQHPDKYGLNTVATSRSWRGFLATPPGVLPAARQSMPANLLAVKLFI